MSIAFEEMLVIIIVAFFLIMLFLSLLYSMPIIFVRTLRHRNHLLTINICLAVTLCAVYHIIYIMLVFQWHVVFSRFLCFVIEFMRMMVVCQVAYAYVTVAIHRYCSIIYFNKPLFNRTRWLVTCTTCQWLFACFISLPIIPYDNFPVEIFRMIKRYLIIVRYFYFRFVNLLNGYRFIHLL